MMPRMIFPMEFFNLYKDKNLFAGARIARGTVVWNDDLDIAPETLYQDSKPI